MKPPSPDARRADDIFRRSRRLFGLILVLLVLSTVLITFSEVFQTASLSSTASRVVGENPAETPPPLAITAPPPPQRVTFYSPARRDRSGAAILDRLLCHAFSWAEGVTYGGACEENVASEGGADASTHEQQQQALLVQSLGLAEELPLACPTDRSGILLKHEDYFAQDTAVLTEDWLAHMRRSVGVGLPSTSLKTVVDPWQVAVHIRRGDVTPCTEFERYLPNAYYLAVLDHYLPKLRDSTTQRPVQVTIYSDTENHEAWDVFVYRGYRLELGTNLTDAWYAMRTADVLVLSKSSFSLVPALWNPNTVLYTPFWHAPLSSWTTVDAHLVRVAGGQAELLRRRACPATPWRPS
jgi:hypothetical protein